MNFGASALNLQAGVCAPIAKKPAGEKGGNDAAVKGSGVDAKEGAEKKAEEEKLKNIDRVRGWCEEEFKQYLSEKKGGPSAFEGYKVSMVQEVRCYIPGCAPVEVVIVFSKERSSSKNGKIFKPMVDVTLADVKTFVTKFCSLDEKGDGGTSSSASSSKSSGESHPFQCPCCNPDLKAFDRMLAGELDAGW